MQSGLRSMIHGPLTGLGIAQQQPQVCHVQARKVWSLASIHLNVTRVATQRGHGLKLSDTHLVEFRRGTHLSPTLSAWSPRSSANIMRRVGIS